MRKPVTSGPELSLSTEFDTLLLSGAASAGFGLFLSAVTS